MLGRSQVIRPATVGLGVVLSLFSMLQSSKLVCALVDCGTCHTEWETTDGIRHEGKSCCHSKSKRTVDHSTTKTANRDCLPAFVVSQDSVPFPFKSCPWPEGCVCKANPGPSIPTESISAESSTQSSTLCCPLSDCVLNAGSFNWCTDFSTGYLCANNICVILCRFRA